VIVTDLAQPFRTERPRTQKSANLPVFFNFLADCQQQLFSGFGSTTSLSAPRLAQNRLRTTGQAHQFFPFLARLDVGSDARARVHFRGRHILPNSAGVDHRQMTPLRQRDHFEMIVVDEHKCDFASLDRLIQVR
jgi:hypothetical protein